jgi:hypothetical protein
MVVGATHDDFVRCLRCGRKLSLSYLGRQGRCSYCSLELTGAPVWAPVGAGWHPGEVKALGRPAGEATVVSIKLFSRVRKRVAAFGGRGAS